MRYCILIVLLLFVCLSFLIVCLGSFDSNKLFIYEDIVNIGLVNNCFELLEIVCGFIVFNRNEFYILMDLCLKLIIYFIKEELINKC